MCVNDSLDGTKHFLSLPLRINRDLSEETKLRISDRNVLN